MGWSRFVPRLSWRDLALLRELPDDRATAVAKALAQAAGDAQLVLRAHSEPVRRVVLEPEAWRNQTPPSMRSREFRRLGAVVSLPRVLDPAALRASSATSLVEYGLAFLNAQTLRGADALLPPYHLASGHGQPDREGELRLAEAVVSLVRSQGLDTRSGSPKPLLLGIALDAVDSGDPSAGLALARSYAGLDADGYWVQFANLTEASNASDISRCCAFLYALQELSGKPVFAVDVKNLVWPLLAGGLFGACIGIGEREAWSGPAGASNERRSLKPTVVHRELLRNFVARGQGAQRAFREYPCGCGAHEPAEVPARKPDIRRHALRVRLMMADVASGADAVAAVEGWLARAGWAAAELGIEQPRGEAYRAALAAASWRSVASG